MGNLIRKSPEDDKDEQLKRLQAEVDTLKTQMLGQRALIQGLAQEQGELRAMISQLHQGKSNMKLPVRVRDQVFDQLPRGQQSGMVKNGPPQVVTTSQTQHQRGNRRKRYTPGRHFSETGIPSSLMLKRLLEVNLITLKGPPQNPDTSAPTYNPDERCAYHSDSPGHDTDDCWSLKNKIQDLIDGRVLEFMPGGQIKIFC